MPFHKKVLPEYMTDEPEDVLRVLPPGWVYSGIEAVAGEDPLGIGQWDLTPDIPRTATGGMLQVPFTEYTPEELGVEEQTWAPVDYGYAGYAGDPRYTQATYDQYVAAPASATAAAAAAGGAQGMEEAFGIGNVDYWSDLVYQPGGGYLAGRAGAAEALGGIGGLTAEQQAMIGGLLAQQRTNFGPEYWNQLDANQQAQL